jgi:hypothetical protein
MVSAAEFRKLAFGLPEVVEAPHFDRASFRANGKIFATLSEKEGRAMVKLTAEQQDVMTAAEPSIFQRIPNAWGEKGATWMVLRTADRRTAESALKAAHANVTIKAPVRRTKRRG